MTTLACILCNDPVYQSLPPRSPWLNGFTQPDIIVPYGNLRAAARDMLLFQKIWERQTIYGTCVILMEGEK